MKNHLFLSNHLFKGRGSKTLSTKEEPAAAKHYWCCKTKKQANIFRNAKKQVHCAFINPNQYLL